MSKNFPSFLEGLSLRPKRKATFHTKDMHFPSFLEGLSLRRLCVVDGVYDGGISLPSWRGFH